MNTFEPILDQVRKDRPQLFQERALTEEQPREAEVWDIDVPTDAEISDLRRQPTPAESPIDDETQTPYRASPEVPRIEWTQFELEENMFEHSDEAERQREPYGQRPRSRSTELLAIYRPFHLYPKGDWGVLFFEKNMLLFCQWLIPHFLALGYQPSTTRKMITYAIARHEFVHFLNELKTLELEMLKPGQVFLPYLNQVYKKTYPSIDCVEETVATVWQWDNNVMRDPANLQKSWRAVIKSLPDPAYNTAGNLDHETVRPLEDKLSAQCNTCAIFPKVVPPVWGTLPRPYVQPWTRYENVPFMMTRSAGGKLASQLNSGSLRKTMQIFHV